MSLIYEGRDLTMGWRWASMYAETCLEGRRGRQLWGGQNYGLCGFLGKK